MKKWVPFAVAVAAMIGCDARTGSSAQLPHAKLYPGAKIISNGENQGVVGANLTTPDSPKQVIEFYCKEFGVPNKGYDSQTFDVVSEGHKMQIMVTRGIKGLTAISIIEPK
ncbi:MAG: hypothetical protein JST12_07580 [Armatimonadetes bacterium]|nr:hypothetical protein [Armatimonadota bacterium]